MGLILAYNYNIKEYKSIRNEKNDIEISWIIRDSNILNICKQCNGYYSYEKELPSFCNKLSKRQVDILLHIMILGDGTKNKNNAWLPKVVFSSLFSLESERGRGSLG